jgi:hypothetical protein
LRPLLTKVSSNSKSTPFIESLLFWPTLVSPIAIAFLGGLFFTRRKKIVTIINQNSITKERQKKVTIQRLPGESVADYKKRIGK